MANGDGMPRIPGFSVGWNVTLSNAAILVGGITAVAWLWLTMNNKGMKAPAMDDETLGQSVESDVLSYAASSQTVSENRDRIRAAINRMRDTFRAAREAYQKKIRDLHIALRKNTITHEQFQAQHRAALLEFKAAIKARHREIFQLLHIPHVAHDHVVTPTLG